MSTNLPPYFQIDPDQALTQLGAPTGTKEFQSMAEACARGRADLASRGMEQNL